MAEENSSGYVSIKCSIYCGFSYSGYDQQAGKELFANHKHDSAGSEVDTEWYEYVFSFWGAMIVFFIVIVIVFLVVVPLISIT